MAGPANLPSEKEIIESLLFATDEPLSLRQISDILTPSDGGGARISPDRKSVV
jgi:chromosome segregation and condensation protein ScpB